MQIKLISIPVLGGEALNEELNVFLRSKKVLQVEQQLVQDPQGALWCFCIKYVEDYSPFTKAGKIDYKQVLDEASFQRFSGMREIRKQIAQEAGVPPYAVFTDEELAELAKIEALDAAKMKQVKGIGDKKVEKYGHHFFFNPTNEKSESPA